MKLHEIFTESTTGNGYGSLTLNKKSTTKIHNILKELGISQPISDLHITIIYDRSNPKTNIVLDKDKEYNADITGVKMLGEPDSKWYAIALTLDAPEIEARHKDYIDAGFTYSYPEFIPHLSLKYKPSENDIKIIKDNIDKFKDLKLIFSNEKLELIKE
jgi:hypothetical protein